MPGYFDPLPKGNDARGWSEDQLRIWHKNEGKPFDMPWGILGYALRTSNQTGFTTIADIANLAVTFTTVGDRYIKVTGHFRVQQITGAGIVFGSFREGTTVLGRVGVHTLQTNERDLLSGSVIQTPAAGTYTYKLSLETTANSVNMEAATGGDGAFILVEDIGPVT